MGTNLQISCLQHCMCIQFRLNDAEKAKFKKNFRSKKYSERFKKELKETGAKLALEWSLGTTKTDPSKTSIAFRILPSRHADQPIDYKEVFKFLPLIQKRISSLKRYGFQDLELTACTQLSFSMKAFKPVGDFPLPTVLPLSISLANKVGNAKLTTFGMVFENSPLGLRRAEIESDTEDEEISVTVSAHIKPRKVENSTKNLYEHVTKIAQLFVVSKNE